MSVEVGWRKPRVAIFTAALDELGIEPHRAVFAGDGCQPDNYGPTYTGVDGSLASGSPRAGSVRAGS